MQLHRPGGSCNRIRFWAGSENSFASSQRYMRRQDPQRRLPERYGSSEYEKFDAVKVVELRTFSVAVEDNELQPQEGVFGDQFRLAAHQVGGCTLQWGKGVGFEPALDLILNSSAESTPEFGGH